MLLGKQRSVRLAQLDRAFGYGPKGRGFESSRPRLKALQIEVLFSISSETSQVDSSPVFPKSNK